MTWEALAIVVGALVAGGAVMRGMSWFTRYRATRAIPTDQLVRDARGVSLRVLVHGPAALPGMNPRRANRTGGDLLLTADRFLLASGRGTLLDLRPERGRRLTSVRCPAPGKLVIEGDRPGARGQPGLFRIEVMLPDAVAWAEALQAFVVAGDGEAMTYAVKPPWA